MKIRRVLTIVSLLAVTACEKRPASIEPDSHVLEIDSRPPVDCVAGVLQRKCLWVREDGANDWALFYYDIEGFIYEPGYRYTVDVRRQTLPIDGLMDALPYRYSLIRVIDKVK